MTINKFRNFIQDHRLAITIVSGLLLLSTVQFIPPIEKIFFIQRRVEALYDLCQGIFAFLLIPASFFGYPISFLLHILVILTTIFSIGFLIEKLWRNSKFKIIILLLVLHIPCGMFVISTKDTVVGGVYATCEKEISDQVKVKIVMYPERGWIPGAHYFFMETRDNGGSWHQIMHFRHDDPVDPPCKNIKRINEDFYWVWMGWKLAVTGDGGQSWNTWTPEKSWPDWTCCNYGLIEEVEFKNTKYGTMYLNPIGNGFPAQRLETTDAGISWHFDQ